LLFDTDQHLGERIVREQFMPSPKDHVCQNIYGFAPQLFCLPAVAMRVIPVLYVWRIVRMNARTGSKAINAEPKSRGKIATTKPNTMKRIS
jgi:hypothetical protein